MRSAFSAGGKRAAQRVTDPTRIPAAGSGRLRSGDRSYPRRTAIALTIQRVPGCRFRSRMPAHRGIWRLPSAATLIAAATIRRRFRHPTASGSPSCRSDRLAAARVCYASSALRLRSALDMAAQQLDGRRRRAVGDHRKPGRVSPRRAGQPGGCSRGPWTIPGVSRGLRTHPRSYRCACHRWGRPHVRTLARLDAHGPP